MTVWRVHGPSGMSNKIYQPLRALYQKDGGALFIMVLLLAFNTVRADIGSAELLHGERLFLDARFSESFYRFIQRGGKYNQAMDRGDPQLDKTYRFFGLPPYQIPFAAGPYRGSAFSCQACHMVDEHADQTALGMRAYADFASRTPLPKRSDNQSVTLRNSPILISSSAPRDHLLLHADGEFDSLKALILGTLTGRNFGWLLNEKELARQHICNVVKNDDGSNALGREFGGFSYRQALSGKTRPGQTLTEEYLIQPAHRLDIDKASCRQILAAIARLLEAFVNDLRFSQDDSALSPYDRFLALNSLPRTPHENESHQDYSRRLVARIAALESSDRLTFISKNDATEDGGFRFHDPLYKFGKIELQGLKIFFNQSNEFTTGKGNCVACHPAPHFTDFKFHNIGVTQIEYETIHGAQAFNKLLIPSLSARTRLADTYLPATTGHPQRRGVFKQAASPAEPLYTDLGAWNVLFNHDYPGPQQKLLSMFCDSNHQCENKDIALQRAIATVKTPTLRNLGHSAPYMHNGQISDLAAVISFYINISGRSPTAGMRNLDKEIKNIGIKPADIAALTQFLISLYEDYD